MHDVVRAGEERRRHDHHRLVGGLRVARLARGQPAARAPGQAVAPRHLAGAEQADRRLGRAERGRARLHVGVREERAQDHGAAGIDELRQGDARERLGQLLGERRWDRDRRHRAHQQERRDDDRLVGAVVLEHRGQHAVVEAQRRVDVDQRDHGRRLLDRRAPAEQDLGHADRVGRVRAGRHGAHVGLVRERLQRQHHVEVARVERRVVRLDDRAAGHVELGERLRELHEVAVVVDASRRGARRPGARRAGRRPTRRPCGRRRCARCWPDCAPGRRSCAVPWPPARG